MFLRILSVLGLIEVSFSLYVFCLQCIWLPWLDSKEIPPHIDMWLKIQKYFSNYLRELYTFFVASLDLGSCTSEFSCTLESEAASSLVNSLLLFL